MAEIYDTTRFGELLNLSQNPRDESLALAAAFLIRTLEPNNISVVVMGGFALRLRGGTRATTDVDVTVNCTIDQLVELLQNNERYDYVYFYIESIFIDK